MRCGNAKARRCGPRPNLDEGRIDVLLHCHSASLKHVDAALARIWMFDLTRAQLELQASAGVDTRLDGPHSRIPVGQFEIGLIAKEKVPRLTNDLPSDPAARDKTDLE